MNLTYLRDLLERVLSTLLATAAGALVTLQVTTTATGVHISGVHQVEGTLAGAGVGAGISLLKGLAASLRGDSNSASLSALVTNPAEPGTSVTESLDTVVDVVNAIAAVVTRPAPPVPVPTAPPAPPAAVVAPPAPAAPLAPVGAPEPPPAP